MIDLSITKDPKWIKAREKLWKPIGKHLSEDLRKEDLDKIHNYFMTGELRNGEKIADGAAFCWHPIQTPESWDYLFQYVVKDEQQYAYWFYFSFCDLSNRALNAEQELAMWDYFAGDVFQPEVTSRVPVGQKGEKVSFRVDKSTVASHIGRFFNQWATGVYKHKSPKPKYVDRINYYLSMLATLTNEDFLEKGFDGYPASEVGGCVTLAFVRVLWPKYSEKFTEEELAERKQFFEFLRNYFENMDMPSEMRVMWEKVKKGEIK
ncbi:MAG: hypothetical protein IPK77_05585 [Cellvibrio sp.]|nr:hypothetical protein [Cellvibrio sp.]